MVAILIKRSRHDAVHLSFANELQVDRHVIDAVDQHIVAQTAVIDGLPAEFRRLCRKVDRHVDVRMFLDDRIPFFAGPRLFGFRIADADDLHAAGMLGEHFFDLTDLFLGDGES